MSASRLLNQYRNVVLHFSSKTNARGRSLPDNLHQHTLAAITVEFAVEDLFPRAEVELAFRDRAQFRGIMIKRLR